MNRFDNLRIATAYLRYYMHIPNPENLSDTEWAMRLKELEFIRQEEAKSHK